MSYEKKVLALLIAITLSFSTVNTVVFAEETGRKTIVDTENETVNNLLEIAKIYYEVCRYSNILLGYIEWTNDWIYIPQEKKEEQLQHIEKAYFHISDFKQSLVELNNSLNNSYGNNLILSGDIETAKEGIQSMIFTCEMFEEILPKLKAYITDDNWEGVTIWGEALIEMEENFNEFQDSCYMQDYKQWRKKRIISSSIN